MENKLSTVIITLNEEKNIENCIKSVLDISDEILVVDSLSTDKTKEICEKYDVKFVEQKFLGYRDQKNFAMNAAENNYVLSLDADEAVSEDLKKIIIEQKEKGFEYDAFYINLLYNFGGKWIRHGEWYPNKKIRLWNREKGEWGGQNIHENVKMKKDASIKRIKVDILHYPYEDIADFNKQLIKFAKVWSQEKFNKNKKTNLFSAIGRSIFKFVRGYIFQFGFLDGFYGYVIAKSSAHYTFLKYTGLM
ncbi:MAG: glycosyltransferase family 2 protein, partial [Bacteroidota bacterium]|nr:glycosyltransferase family 2 protein [Bacteroidota bacterium]